MYHNNIKLDKDLVAFLMRYLMPYFFGFIFLIMRDRPIKSYITLFVKEYSSNVKKIQVDFAVF